MSLSESTLRLAEADCRDMLPDVKENPLAPRHYMGINAVSDAMMHITPGGSSCPHGCPGAHVAVLSLFPTLIEICLQGHLNLSVDKMESVLFPLARI